MHYRVGGYTIKTFRRAESIPREVAVSATSEFRVQGMTCDHCVRAVEAAVAAVPGVTRVAAELPTGRLVVDAGEPVDPAAVAAAVEEAGYVMVTT